METNERGPELSDVDYSGDSFRNVSDYVHAPGEIVKMDREEQEKAIRVGLQVSESMKTPGNRFMWGFMEDQLTRFKDSYDTIPPEELVKLQQFVTVIREMIELPVRLVEAGDVAREELHGERSSRDTFGYGTHL